MDPQPSTPRRRQRLVCSGLCRRLSQSEARLVHVHFSYPKGGLTSPLSLVIVVGHSNCGGAAACVKAVSTPPQETNTPLLRWLTPLANLARELKVDSLKPDEALSLLVKENVRKQVKNLFESETISKAWARGQLVHIHGWIYELSTGKLVDLEMPEPLHPYGK